MSQWGQQPRPGGQWGTPQQQWGAPRAQQRWQGQEPGWGGQAWQQPQQRGVQQWQGYGPPSRPPRRGSNPLKTLLMVIGVVLLGMVLMGQLSDLGGGVGGGGGGGGTVQTPPGEYQNEEYQVPPVDVNPPPLPMPETYGEATQWLQENPVYQAEIAVPVRCGSAPIDLTSASIAQLEGHFNELTECLMRVFAPAIESVGYTMPRPSVTIYTEGINTRCGRMPAQNAAYCSADQQIYYAEDMPSVIPAQLRGVQYVVESVVAHEFAHAMQARTGLLISSAAWEQNSTEPVANNFSRRLEVQADCFAGQFIQSVGQSVGVDEQGAEQISLLFYAIGDDLLTGDPNVDGNHGRGQNRQGWYEIGYTNTSMGACNTYIAPDDAVA